MDICIDVQVVHSAWDVQVICPGFFRIYLFMRGRGSGRPGDVGFFRVCTMYRSEWDGVGDGMGWVVLGWGGKIDEMLTLTIWLLDIPRPSLIVLQYGVLASSAARISPAPGKFFARCNIRGQAPGGTACKWKL